MWIGGAGALLMLTALVGGIVYANTTNAHASTFETTGMPPTQAQMTQPTATVLATGQVMQPTATVPATGQGQMMNQDVAVMPVISMGDGHLNGWSAKGRQITSMEDSQAHTVFGTHSLRINFANVTAATTLQVSARVNIQVMAGQALSVYVYVPGGTGTLLAQPFTVNQMGQQVGVNGFVRLAPGLNRLTHAFPAQVNGRVTQLGVQFKAATATQQGAAMKGHIYVVAATLDTPVSTQSMP
jgi:hypothetical protein